MNDETEQKEEAAAEGEASEETAAPAEEKQEAAPKKKASTKKAKAAPKKSKPKKEEKQKDQAAGPYAIMRTGGKQYRVSPGQQLSVELLSQAVGEKVEISDVLLVRTEKQDEPIIGTPVVDGAKVTATVVAQKKNPKQTIFKKKILIFGYKISFECH